MTKLYIGKTLPEYPYLPLLYPNLGFEKRGGQLYADTIFRHYQEPAVQIVDTPEQADFIAPPHIHTFLTRRKEYLESYIALSEATGKPLLFFAYGDKDENLAYPNSLVFRYSQYRYKKRENDFIMPPYASDLLEGSLLLREKENRPPIVGFCGWANYETFFIRLKTLIRHLLLQTESLLLGRPELLARKKGLFFRIEALDILSRSHLMTSNFIIRRSHGLHKETVTFSPEEARKEYIENILGSDLSLAVKGDGNASVRFYEILSLGRIPVFLDTECLLPFEDVIDYDNFILRIDYREMATMPEKIAQFYKNISDEQFIEKQKKAREVFERYLRIDAFFKKAFSDPHQLLRMVR